MASTGSSRPMAAQLIALAALLALFALAATPASASQLNFFSGQRCTGRYLGVCGDFTCCRVPSGTVSYEFRYVPGYKAYRYKDPGCAGNSISNIPYEISCSGDINFRSAIITNELLKQVAK